MGHATAWARAGWATQMPAKGGVGSTKERSSKHNAKRISASKLQPLWAPHGRTDQHKHGRQTEPRGASSGRWVFISLSMYAALR